MCLLTNERYKTYQTGFSFGRLGHAPGVGLGGTVGGCGVKKIFFPKFNQIWCVSYLHEWHMQRHHFLGPRPLGPWGKAKRSNIIKSELQSQFQRFLNQTFCIFSHERYITYQTAFSFGRLGHAKGWDLGVPWGLGAKNFFFQNSTRFGVLVTYMNCTCSGTIVWVPSPWGLGEGSKI